MLKIEDQLSILVHLSMADDFLAKEESKLIRSIGERNGLTSDQIEKIIDKPGDIPNLRDLLPEEKFGYLFEVVQLMKVDGKIHQKEINFCEKIALALGYKPGVVADLSAYIYSDPNISTKKDFLRSVADKHLMPKGK